MWYSLLGWGTFWIALIIGLGFYIYMRLSEKKEHKQAIKEYQEKHKENVQETVKK